MTRNIKLAKLRSSVTCGATTSKNQLNCSDVGNPLRLGGVEEHHVDMELDGDFIKVTCRQRGNVIFIPLSNVEFFTEWSESKVVVFKPEIKLVATDKKNKGQFQKKKVVEAPKAAEVVDNTIETVDELVAAMKKNKK
jgi:hypothetical protein